MRKLITCVADELLRESCPKCDVYFLLAHGKSPEYLEGAESTCPNCKTVYGTGLFEQELDDDENPDDFMWTKARCKEYRKCAAEYYAYYGYEHAFRQCGELIDAFR